MKCKEPRGSENVRADSGRGENNVTKLPYTHTSLRALASRPITEDRSVIATTGELASRPITEDRSVIATTGELASRPITEDQSVIATTGERRNDL